MLLAPLVLVAPPREAATWPVVLSLLALAIPCTVLAYLLYFRLIANLGPTKTSTVTFLIPLFGILWARVFLHEPVTLGLFAGLGVILLSVWLVLGEKRGEAAGGGRE